MSSGFNQEQAQQPVAIPRSTARPNSAAKQQHKRAVKKQDTHFLCFPLVNSVSVPQLAKSLAHFRSIALREDQIKGNGEIDATDSKPEQIPFDTNNASNKLAIIDEKAFRPPGTYHLTLGVMDLSRPEQMNKALKLLNGIDIDQMLQQADLRLLDRQLDLETSRTTNTDLTNIATAQQQDILSLQQSVPPREKSKSPTKASPNPLTISLTGLATFPSARSARVFYAKPLDPTARLHNFAVAIRQCFRTAGLITENRPLVLHATVGNLRYAVQKTSGKNRGGQAKPKTQQKDEGLVDAREIIKIFDEQGGQIHDNESNLSLKTEFLWAENIVIDHLAICKLGATQSDDPVLELEYPPIATRSIYDDSERGESR